MKENDFASAIKKTTRDPIPQSSVIEPLERGSKHVGGYFHPDVSKTLKQIALDENTTVQALLGEALTMLLQARGKAIHADS